MREISRVHLRMNEPADRKKIIMRRKKVFEAIDVKTMLILKTNKKFM